MKRFVMIAIVLVLNTFAAVAQNTPENVMPLVYITEPADQQPGYPNFDLYVMNPQTGGILFKSTSPNKDCPLATSPDGKAIIYQQQLSGDSPVRFAHYFVDLTTGEQRKIELGDILLQQSTVEWSGDDNKFYFNVQKHNDNRIYEYDLTTDTLNEVAHIEPVIHLMRLGTEVVYWSVNNRKLVINDFKGNSYELQYSELFSMGRPSPDGQHIVREVNKEQYRDENGLVLYQYDYILSGLTEKDLITISDAQRGEYEHQFGLAWRPDSQAVFYFDLDRNFVVYDLVHRQKTLFPVPDISGLSNLSGNWSPDGHYIVFSVDYGASITHHNQIELSLIDTATSEISPVSSYDDENARRAGFIQWVDDNQFIYFSGRPGYDAALLNTKSSEIIRYDVIAKTYTNLTNTPGVAERADCWYG